MSKLSDNLKPLVDQKPTKTEWSTYLIQLFGNARKVRCFRDPNAAAANPSATGVEFLSVGSSGDIPLKSGDLSGFGDLSGVTKRLAADLSTGASALVFEGNGYSIIYSLGLKGSGKEFELAFNPTGSQDEGFAITPGSGMRAPIFLDSGTGPLAGKLLPTTPTVIKLYDAVDKNNPVLIGTAHFSAATRQENWVFEHPDMAAEIGDGAIYYLDTPIEWAAAKFVMGGILFITNAYNSEDGSTQLEQFLPSFTPLATWQGYPAMEHYVEANWVKTGVDANGKDVYTCTNPDEASNTFPPPYIIKLETATGTLVHTYQMEAFNDTPTLPMNSPELSQLIDTVKPLVPHVTCGQMPPWQNKRPRMSSRARKYSPAVSARSYGPKVCREGLTTNPSIPLYDAYKQVNSLNHFFAMPPYPMRYDDNFGDNDPKIAVFDPAPRDPYLFEKSRYKPDYGKPFRLFGWKYQYGGICGHDNYTGKGGQRFERSYLSSVQVIAVSNPNYVRPEGNVPILDMMHSFALAYFNENYHWISDPKTMSTVPADEVDIGAWIFSRAYYGGGPTQSSGRFQSKATCVNMVGINNGSGREPWHNDASGRMPWQGSLRDSLHSYKFSGDFAMQFNSLMHAWSNIFFYNAHWMSSLGDAAPDAPPMSTFLKRTQAWRFKAYVTQWLMGTKHPAGLTQERIERRCQKELEAYYDAIYDPVVNKNSQDINMVAIRNLGVVLEYRPGVRAKAGGGYENVGHFQSGGGSLAFYMGHALAIWKQTGFWAKMKKRSTKCKLMLEFLMSCMDKQAIDYILQSSGRDAYYQYLTPDKVEGYNWTGADIPATWAQQKVILDTNWPVLPPDTPESALPDYDDCRKYKDFGTRYTGMPQDQCSSQHLLYQWVKIRKIYFPEYLNANLDAAIAKYETYYAAMEAYADSSADHHDWQFRFPSHGDLLAPTELGPN